MDLLDESEVDSGFVFLPARQVIGPGEQVFAELRRLPDGRIALPCYSTLPGLVEACGPHQSWVSVPAAWLDRLHRELGFDAVAMNLPLAATARHQVAEHDWPGKPEEWDD
jgi:hypothetical protein